MTQRYAEWRPARVLTRCAGLGAGLGALIGFIVLLTLALVGIAESAGTPSLSDLAGLVVPALFALVIGAAIGTPCGVAAFMALLLARLPQQRTGVSATGRTTLRVRRACAAVAAGSGGALPPAAFAVAAAARDTYWGIAWLCVGALALAAGLALGPYLMYGPARPGKRPARTRHADLHSAV